MKPTHNRFIFFSLLVLPILLFTMYNMLGWDNSGGFFEYHALGIRMFLAMALVAGGLITIWNNVWPSERRDEHIFSRMVWLAFGMMWFMFTAIVLIVIWGLRHGIGF